MPLVVETGVGLVGAESLASVAQFRAHCDNYGYDHKSMTDLAVERALRRGSDYIDSRYERRWKGLRRVYSQARSWPRSDVVDHQGGGVPYDSIPAKVVKAVCEASWRELVNPGSLSPDFVASRAVKSKSVGPISKTYFGTGTVSDVRPVIDVIDGFLWEFLRGSSTSLTGTAVRG